MNAGATEVQDIVLVGEKKRERKLRKEKHYYYLTEKNVLNELFFSSTSVIANDNSQLSEW